MSYAYTWWIWIFFMMLWFLPMSYGWGYRGWGAPYPTYIQRRRGEGAVRNGLSGLDHQRWGWMGDLIWVMVVLELACFAILFWHRH